MTERSLRAVRDGVRAAILLFAVALVLAHGVPLPPRAFSPPARVVADVHGEVLFTELAPDGRLRLPVAVDAVDPALIRALLALEDQRFRWHLGVDPWAVVRATLGNLRAGRVESGASTITMQVVRLWQPRPRTLGAKVIEAARAVQLELIWPKERILRAWLSHAPFGRNIEGIEAGALATFGHRAHTLDAEEICTLLAIPQDPTHRHPSARNGPALDRWRKAIGARLVAKDALLHQDGSPYSLGELEATWGPVPTRLRPMPRQAVHASRFLLGKDAAEGAQRPGRIHSTLDAGVQQRVERRLVEERESLRRRGIHNAAVAVVDREQKSVVALVGNLDVDDADHAGQIAAFAVPRSPGSALKPVLYGLGVERGLILPDMLVADVPSTFGTYSPRNYDGSWTGLLRWEDALSHSLNVPFVALLQEIGLPSLKARLDATGLGRPLATGGPYGLSVAVGGVEVTLLEMVVIYAAIANGGAVAPLQAALEPLRWRDADDDAGGSLLSPEAAWFVRRALRVRDRPDFPERRRLGGAPRGIHWKTGTSSGRRDAWALGSGPRYTVGIWLGNLDQRGSALLSGADAAAPLLFDVLESLEPATPPPPDDPPAGLGLAWVCAWSGHPAGPACPQRREAQVLVHHVPQTPCPWHVRREVDTATGALVAPGCREGRNTVERTFVLLPDAVRRHLASRGQEVPGLPALAPGCGRSAPKRAPKILQPVAGHRALLLPGLAADRQQVPLLAEGEGSFDWFVDGLWLGSAPAGERLWWTPTVGVHEITLVDGGGRKEQRRLEVAMRE